MNEQMIYTLLRVWVYLASEKVMEDTVYLWNILGTKCTSLCYCPKYFSFGICCEYKSNFLKVLVMGKKAGLRIQNNNKLIAMI